MKRIALSVDQHALLREHAEGVHRPYSDDFVTLQRHGLIHIGKGRFGQWSRITDLGRKHLDRMSGRGGGAASKTRETSAESLTGGKDLQLIPPEAAPGPADAGVLLRGAVPRSRRTTAKQAGSVAADLVADTCPPSVPLNVKGTMADPAAVRQRAVKADLLSTGTPHIDRRAQGKPARRKAVGKAVNSANGPGPRAATHDGTRAPKRALASGGHLSAHDAQQDGHRNPSPASAGSNPAVRTSKTSSGRRRAPVSEATRSRGSECLATATAGGTSPHDVVPNAVRVVIDATATYYPLSAYESLRHGEKQRVHTTNPFYRRLLLAASERNDSVLREP